MERDKDNQLFFLIYGFTLVLPLFNVLLKCINSEAAVRGKGHLHTCIAGRKDNLGLSN